MDTSNTKHVGGVSPLAVRIVTGMEDQALLRHIDFLMTAELEGARENGAGISLGERRILEIAWKRLDELTR